LSIAATSPDHGPVLFFKAHQQAFRQTTSQYARHRHLIDGLLSRAFSSFEVNAAEQSRGAPAPVCYDGCATCCTLRVTATAPEVLLIARQVAGAPAALTGRLLAADKVTRGLGETERVRLRRPCPFLRHASCLIYPVRPLACRAHISYDENACVEAAAGRRQEIPNSPAHLTVRSLIQNAMQSALRDAGLAWGLYELNQAVCLALGNPGCEQDWLDGGDIFSAAQVDEVSPEEMAQTYDAINAQTI